ncbi:MAG TPA: hypothetical protein VIQ23_15020 [Hanamia sp.]
MTVSTNEPDKKDREAVAKVKFCVHMKQPSLLVNITLFRDNSLYHAFP